MGKSWYASVDMPSIEERPVRFVAPRCLGRRDRARGVALSIAPGAWQSLGLCRPFVLLVAAAAMVAGCAAGAGSAGAVAAPRAVGRVAGPAPAVSSETTVTLAGARCQSSRCICREPGREDDAETAPPSKGSKRFEIRMTAGAGEASLALSGIGTIAASGPAENCAYVDLPAGGQRDVRLTARESIPGGGVAPVVRFAEYGPKGPYWYDVIAIHCNGSEGRCDRGGANEWAEGARRRKRGRLDPCGSSVVTRLMWETSGGQIEREGGLFRDFTVTFNLDVKRFATQFPPGATECVPK